MKEIWKMLRYDMPYVILGVLGGLGLISVIMAVVDVVAR